MEHLTLRADRETEQAGISAEATIDVGAGGRLRRVAIISQGQTVDLLAPVPDDADPTSSGWGSYPMAPWAGRLRHGRFDHPGAIARLGRNHRDGHGDGGGPIAPPLPPIVRGPAKQDTDPDEPLAHAIHGTVFARRWSVDEHTESSVSMSCSLTDPADPLTLAWPFSGMARQTITLRPDAIELMLEVALDDQPLPVVIGWHPWFAKPDRLDVELDAMYEVDDIGLPTGRLIDPTPGPWDACFTSTSAATLHYHRPIAPEVTVSSDCDHLVVYDKPAHATCVEPQSGPPDAANLLATGALATPGAAEFGGPDNPVRRTMTIAWHR